MTAAEYRAYVEWVVDQAPPVTEAQRAKLAPLLRRGVEQLRERTPERRAA